MTQQEWKQQRIGKFSASNIHKLLKGGRSKDTLFGETAMSYIYNVAAELLTGESEEITSKAMEWGVYHEPNAMEAYRKRTGLKVEYFGGENPKFFEFTEYSGGSPDGLTETHLLEIKCPFNSANHVENLTLNENTFITKRPEYYAQMQFNMLITKRDFGHFISFDPRMASEREQLFILEIKADYKFQDNLTERIKLAENELKSIIKSIVSHE